jgi:hypothetical protein
MGFGLAMGCTNYGIIGAQTARFSVLTSLNQQEQPVRVAEGKGDANIVITAACVVLPLPLATVQSGTATNTKRHATAAGGSAA